MAGGGLRFESGFFVFVEFSSCNCFFMMGGLYEGLEVKMSPCLYMANQFKVKKT
jgi:hypothetical protein